MTALAPSVCLSVCRWKAVERQDLICRRVQSVDKKVVVDWGPWFETIVLGRPWSFQTLSTYMWAKSVALAVSLQGIRCCILMRQSTITKMASKPSLVERPVTKLIESSSHRRLRTGRGCRLPKGELRMSSAGQQVRQLRRYRSMYFLNFGQYYSHEMRLKVFALPAWPVEGASWWALIMNSLMRAWSGT